MINEGHTFEGVRFYIFYENTETDDEATNDQAVIGEDIITAQNAQQNFYNSAQDAQQNLYQTSTGEQQNFFKAASASVQVSSIISLIK